jgi:hypothetical protein
MKWLLALVLAAIFLMPFSATAMTPSYRGYSVPGPGGDYGIVEENACGLSSTYVLLGPIKFCLPCRITTVGLSASLTLGIALAAVRPLRRRIENRQN